MPERNPITEKPVVYSLPGMEKATVRRDLAYGETGAEALLMDVYYPAGMKSGARLPAVVLVVGYSDIGARRVLGCAFKEMKSFISWAQLIAASGMVAVISTTGNDPAQDAHSLLGFIQANADTFAMDANRIGIWACSGHGPTALSLLIGASLPVRCATLMYAYTLDLEGNRQVANAAAQFRFANPVAGRTAESLRPEISLCVVRAGRDQMPGLNDSLDRFIAAAVGRNLDLTLVNYPAGVHAFDILDESAEAKRIVSEVLGFMRCRLGDR